MQVHFNLHEKSNSLTYQLNKNSQLDILKRKYDTKEYLVEFLDSKGKVLGYENKIYPKKILSTGSFDILDKCLLVTKETNLNTKIWGLVITDKTLKDKEQELKERILIFFVLIAIIVAFLGYVLSRLFLKPINNHIKSLNTFINDINHELNTPITSLLMSSKQLDTKYEKRLVKSVVISSKQLFEIYKSLIELNFDIKEKTEELDLKILLEESIKYFQEILLSKDIQINAKLESFIYTAHKDKMQRVFNNLISNAIKYSYPKSKIDISFKNGILEVKDYGIGIKEEHQDKIFERFYQANEYTRGFGIGLDVIRRICFQYKIKISLKSIKDVNTVFILDFNKTKN